MPRWTIRIMRSRLKSGQPWRWVVTSNKRLAVAVGAFADTVAMGLADDAEKAAMQAARVVGRLAEQHAAPAVTP
jgi:hypothetical protein